MVYLAIMVMMLLSAFGLPLPEEFTIVTTGLLSYMGAHPELFPPPFEGAPVVNKYWASAVCVFAIFSADLAVYGIGRTFGRRIITHPRLQHYFSEAKLNSVEKWTHKYGVWAVFVLRFSPGLRFPGHLACGLLRFPLGKFMAVDAFAMLISVPTQIILIAIYGEVILSLLHKFKYYFVIGLAVVICFLVLKRFLVKRA